MRKTLFFTLSVICALVFTLPVSAQEKCGYSASGKWGLLSGTTFVVAGDATAKSCRGITLSLEGPMGIIGAKPNDIMTAQGAASFATHLTFIARSFIPEDERIATVAGQMPWQFIPDLEKVTPSQTQLALRRSDSLANTVFFRLAAGQLAFLQVRAVDGLDYDALLEGGDLLNADL